MGLTSISVVCSVVILNLHYRGRTLRRPPQFLIRFLERWPRRLLCIVPPPDPTLICPVAYTSKNGLEEVERHMLYNSKCYQEQIQTTEYKINRLKRATRLFGNPRKYYFNKQAQMAEDVPIELLQNNWFARHQDCNYIDDLDDNNECQNQTKAPIKDILANGRVDSPLYKFDNSESHTNPARLYPKMGTNRITQRKSSCSTPWQSTDFEDYAKKCTKRFLHAEYEILCIKEWEYIAIFLDRILLHVFSGILALSSIWLLYVKPMEKNLNFEREINVTLESNPGS
ncbi:hypothetical protein Ciccas_013825 [Cichlidogyrus casuarinus]|uniref:Neurotransmitter-gated ion-channel transmembrane domain-containing protein n=1 Tax=Cichlidogyrus casuarinus TaxID=1844966 RepID=A0ABD2PPJ5_9PLAT